MSRVEESVEAGARSVWLDFHADEGPTWAATAWDDMGGGEPTDERAGYELAFRAGLVNAWPVLSAGLRELHREREWRPLDSAHLGSTVCAHCLRDWPCATGRELDRIDWELGIGDDHQSGDPCTRQAPEPGHEDEGYSCSTHNMPWGECPHQSGESSPLPGHPVKDGAGYDCQCGACESESGADHE